MVDFFKLIKLIGISLILLVLELRETDATFSCCCCLVKHCGKVKKCTSKWTISLEGHGFKSCTWSSQKKSCSQSFSCCVFFLKQWFHLKNAKEAFGRTRQQMDLKHVYPISTIQILYEFMMKSKCFISKACCFGVICHHHLHVNSSLNTMLYLGQTSKWFKRGPIPNINSPLLGRCHTNGKYDPLEHLHHTPLNFLTSLAKP
jgi:hypothetical protein